MPEIRAARVQRPHLLPRPLRGRGIVEPPLRPPELPPRVGVRRILCRQRAEDRRRLRVAPVVESGQPFVEGGTQRGGTEESDQGQVASPAIQEWKTPTPTMSMSSVPTGGIW